MTVSGVQIVSEIEKFTGYPYTWGGTFPSTGFDCSGLVEYVLTQLGVKNVPRTSETQYAWATPISPNALQPGDLVFASFPGDSQADPSHVGVYTGNGQVLSAEDPASGVGYSSLASWQPYINGYGRVPDSAATGAPGGTGGTGATGQGGGTVVTSFTGNPLEWVNVLGGVQGILQFPGQWLGNQVSKSGNPLSSLIDISKDVNTATHDFAQFMKWLSWMFAPSNWLRIGAFFFGILCFSGAVFMMTKAR